MVKIAAKETGKAVARSGETTSGLVMFDDKGSMPAYAPEDVGMGLENAEAEDMETPRLKLIQALSPELETFNKLSAGDFLHTASDLIISEPVLVTPIYFDRRYILWNPRESGGGILARADDGVHWQPANTTFDVKLDKKNGGNKVAWKTADTVKRSGLSAWGSMDPNDPNSPPAATLMLNFLFAFPEHPDWMPAVVTFQRSSIRVGRRYVTKLKTIRAPMFGTVFELSSVDDRNNSGDKFKNYQMVSKGLIDPGSELFQTYKAMHLQFKEMGLKVKDLEGLQEDDVGDGADHDDGDEDGKPNY